MLTPGQDFDVTDEYGIPRCVPKTPECSSAFKVLQTQLAKVLPQLPDAPSIEVEVNGIIGPTVALGVQAIALRLSEGPYRELAPLANAQPEEAIPMIAERAMEIAGYVGHALEQSPTAIVAPRAPEIAGFDPLAMIRAIFTPKRMLAGFGGLLALGGLVLLAGATDRRTLGLIDRSALLPPSDGSDEFEEEEGDESDEADDGIDRENAIDVPSTEVAA